jgi:hypothetical protein
VGRKREWIHCFLIIRNRCTSAYGSRCLGTATIACAVFRLPFPTTHNAQFAWGFRWSASSGMTCSFQFVPGHRRRYN